MNSTTRVDEREKEGGREKSVNIEEEVCRF
jgi:hypothetical protein